MNIAPVSSVPDRGVATEAGDMLGNRQGRRGLHGFHMAVVGALLATMLLVMAGSAMAAAGVRKLSGDTPVPVAQGHALLRGPYASNAVLSVNIGLPVRRASELNEVIQAASTPGNPDYGHYLTNAQYLATYAPTSSEVSAAAAWLRRQGLDVTGVSPDNLLVYVRASTIAAEHAFGVAIKTYTFAGREFHANDRNPSVPAGLSIQAVSGLSNYYVPEAATTCTGSVCAYNGTDFRTAYNVSGDGKGQTIGFTLWGTGLPQSDYTAYAKETGTTALKVGASGEDGLEFIPVGGASTQHESGEIALDTQTAHAVAPGVHETYWLGHNNSIPTLEQVLDDAANSSISIISNSWGFPGNGMCYVLDSNMENALQHGAATGKTFYFASGDNGASAGCHYPAVSQYDVAVGGTELEVGAGSIWSSETAFNNSGGCSNSVPRPSWQTGIGKPLEWPSNTCTGRAVPDVSADSCYSTEGSGSNCWAYVYFGGFPGAWGGTSLASPIWAGLSVIWNKLNAAAGLPGVGFAAPLIYSLANTPISYSSDFHDITTGSNGFPATAGWDEATGWGSPNFTNLVNSAMAIPTITALTPTTGPVTGGTSVTITGTKLTGATVVKFGSTNASSFTVDSATSITTVSPAGTGTVDVTVTTPEGTSFTSAADQFTYNAPTVTSVSPNTGLPAGGTSVSITGTELTGATAVKFGSTNATSFTVNSATSITATTPAGTGTVDVTVTTPGGTSTTSAADQFSYVPAPTVTKLLPKKGPAAGGTSVTITGTGFVGVTAVGFGTTNAASFTVNSGTSITAVSPAGTTGLVDVTVATPNGTSAITSKDHFTFGNPTVTNVSPNTGSKAGGTPVTVKGSGFAPGSGTAFKFGKTPGTSASCTSTTECTVLAPPAATKPGAVDVSATAGGKTSKKTPLTDQFTYS
jgi:subtilase family serine protease